MNKFYLSAVSVMISTVLSAQEVHFKQIPPPPPAPQTILDLDGFEFDGATFTDVDGDHDQDILVSARDSDNKTSVQIYLNDGFGNYLGKIQTPIKGLYITSFVVADVDGDQDQDVLVDGINLYKNGGKGDYTEVEVPFERISNSAAAFADIDGDQDQDVLISGYTADYKNITKLYRNDGLGKYTEVEGTPFEGVRRGSIAFADIDNDQDQDVIITGYGTYGGVTKLYKNDGNGSYTEVTDTPFDQFDNSAVAFADIDGDHDQDVLISGYSNSQYKPITELYKNDGKGNYTKVIETPFEGASGSSMAFADVDGDFDQDVLITGYNGQKEFAKLYRNNGSGGYTEVLETYFKGVEQGLIAFADVDGDQDQDVLITGLLGLRTLKLYQNNGTGHYAEVTGTSFTNTYTRAVAFADVDNDNDLDVVISECDIDCFTKLYQNNGIGQYTEVKGTPFIGVYHGAITFADVDGDQDQDVLITGGYDDNRGSHATAQLYKNDGAGNYTLVANTPFKGVEFSAAAFADIDNDNDLDLLITGDDLFYYTTRLYKNNGSGDFTLVEKYFDGVREGSIVFIDVDNDQDQDLFVAGNTYSGSAIWLYKNDGSGNFLNVKEKEFDGTYGSIDLADIDGDSDLDFLLTGYFTPPRPGSTSKPGAVTKFYKNDGQANYTEVVDTSFDKLYDASVAFADVDNDQDQDVLMVGYIGQGQRVTKLYQNDGSGDYTEVIDMPLQALGNGSIAFADVDGDTDPDVFLPGSGSPSHYVAKLYRNTHCSLTTDVQTACGSYTWIDGKTYTKSNRSARYSFANESGCNSVVALDLTIFGTTGTQVVTACERYTWMDGKTYTESNNTATHTLPNAAGCDSVVTLNLTILHNTTATDVQTACERYTWIDGKTYIESNNTATHTLTTTAGCDSVVTLDLTITEIATDTDIQTACGSFTWIDGKTYKSSNNTATHTLKSKAGCDSLVTLDLIIKKSTFGTDNITACGSYTWINGKTYSRSNFKDTYTLTNAAGCDSIVSLNLTINNPLTTTDSITACGSYTWIDGKMYTQSTITKHRFSNPTTCDSIVILNLTINQPTKGTEVVTACESYTWIDGKTYTESNNTATHSIANTSGCDSVVTLNLTIQHNTTATDVQTACGSFTWIDGKTYTESNSTAKHTLTSVAGCDSVVTLNLTITEIDTATTVSEMTLASNEKEATYQWLDCNNNYAIVSGETSQSFTASDPGSYAVEVSKNGCRDTSACVTMAVLGIIDNTFVNDIQMYPNPTNKTIHIDLNRFYADINVEVKDLNGKTVKSASYANTNQVSFDLPKTGMYFVEVRSQQERAVFRVVKQ